MAAQTPLAPDAASAALLTEVREIIPEADLWLETENERFGGRKPKDLIGTADEDRLREMLGRVKYIGVS